MGALADDEAAVLAGAEAARRAYLDAVGRGLRLGEYRWVRIAEAVLAAAEAKRRPVALGPASREFRDASKAVRYGGRSFQTPQEQGLMVALALLAVAVEINGLRAEGSE
jgi:hypothetical protein